MATHLGQRGRPPEPPPEPSPKPDKPTNDTRPRPSAAEQANALIKTGCEKVRSGNPVGGNQLLMQASDKRGDWRDFELCMCLGAGFSAQGTHDTALAWFQRAAALSPKSRDALAGAAREAELAGKTAVASEYYGKLREIEPGNQQARNYLAKHDAPSARPPDDTGGLMPVGGKSP